MPNVTTPTAHRCSTCYGPYGKSAIRCPREPAPTLKTDFVVRLNGAAQSRFATRVAAETFAETLNFNNNDGAYYVEEGNVK